MNTIRVYRKDMVGLNKYGRPCEVCGEHMHSHEWADLGYSGFVINCSKGKPMDKLTEELYKLLISVAELNRWDEWRPAELKAEAERFVEQHIHNVRTPEEWEAIKGITVLDADGWGIPLKSSKPDGTQKSWPAKSWSEPITEEEFNLRLMLSTYASKQRKPE